MSVVVNLKPTSRLAFSPKNYWSLLDHHLMAKITILAENSNSGLSYLITAVSSILVRYFLQILLNKIDVSMDARYDPNEASQAQSKT